MRRKTIGGSQSKVVIDVPVKLDTILKRHGEIPWACVAEQALWQYARQVVLADRIALRSALTETAAKDLPDPSRRGCVAAMSRPQTHEASS